MSDPWPYLAGVLVGLYWGYLFGKHSKRRVDR